MILTGTGTVISVWFACKICRQSFQNIDNFLEHKKEVHLDEFQKLSCIVFEESAIAHNSDYNHEDGSSLPPAAVIKQEQFLSSDDQHLDLKPVIYTAEATKAEGDPSICQIKNETTKFSKTPYVLLQRLTSKKIQQYNKCQTQALLPQHLAVPCKSGEGPFKCPHPNCGEALKARNNLAMHLKTHTHYRPFKCLNPNCVKAFKTRGNLMQHLKSHTQTRLFKCSRTSCEKAFKRRHGLVVHLQSHNQVKAFKCSRTNCGKAFRSRHGLGIHLESHNKKLLKSQKQDCEKLCSTRNRLKSHSETHIQKKKYKCQRPNCDKAYSVKSSYYSHLDTHTKKNQFKCQEPNCGKAFPRKTHLSLHLEIHSDSRPCFHCPYPSCRNVYRSKFALKQHCVSHHSQDSTSGDKLLEKHKKCDRSDCITNRYQRRLGNGPIKCPQPNCTKEFKYKAGLRLHLVSHSSVSAYICSMPNCGKAFKYQVTLKRHFKIHTIKTE